MGYGEVLIGSHDRRVAPFEGRPSCRISFSARRLSSSALLCSLSNLPLFSEVAATDASNLNQAVMTFRSREGIMNVLVVLRLTATKGFYFGCDAR